MSIPRFPFRRIDLYQISYIASFIGAVESTHSLAKHLFALLCMLLYVPLYYALKHRAHMNYLHDLYTTAQLCKGKQHTSAD